MIQVKFRGGMPAAHLPFTTSPRRRTAAIQSGRPAGPTSRAACTVGGHVVDPHHGGALGHGPDVRVASDPSQRVLGRRGGSARRPSPKHAEEPLAAGADQHPGADSPPAAATSASTWAEQGQVVLGGLAEADARVDPDLGDAGRAGPLGQAEQEAVHLGHHVVVAGVGAACRPGCPACAWPPSRRRLGGDRPQSARDVVDQGGAGGHRGPGHRRLDRVDRHPDRSRPGPRPPGSPGAAPRPRRPGSAPGPAGLAAHVHDVGPLGDHLPARGRWPRRRRR